MDTNGATRAIRACLELGVREFVVCGGARNAELVAGLCSLGDEVRLWGYPEERSGAFFALGRCRATGEAVAVVTTSGTAVAELLPATIEAHYSCLPLVLLTADRPEAFRGSGAPQAIEQAGLLGPYAAVDASDWCASRPLHLNVCLEEPDAARISEIGGRLGSGVRSAGRSAEPDADADADATGAVARFIEEGSGLVVMLGGLPEGWRAGVAAFLDRLGVPVWAEATSGLRERGYPPVRDFSAAARVLRIGEVPSCRAWRDLESSDVPVLSVAPNGLPGLARASQVLKGVDWSALVHDREKSTPITLPPEPAESQEADWVHRLSEAIPDGSLVFLGNSLPIREWNRYASFRDRGLRCFANRGANGIDGLLATFLGLAEGEAEAWCLLGDLSALYDLAAPWVLRELSAGNRRIVVLNNGGGKIFRGLKALRGADARTLSMMENPHSLRFRGWASMFGMAYVAASGIDDLRSLPAGDVVIEIIIEG